MYRHLLALLFFYLTIQLGHSQNIQLGDVQNFKVGNIKDNEMTITFTTTIENMSSKGVGVKIKKGKFYKNDEYYGKFKMPKKLKLKKKGENNLNVTLKITLEKDMNIMKEGLKALSGGPMELKITGMLKATWFIFWKRYPFEYSDKLKLKGLSF